MSHQRPIPDVNIGGVYGPRLEDADILYAPLTSLAEIFGREPPPHRHDGYWQLHFIERGRLRLTLDDQRYAGEGPLLFLTPPSTPHAFLTDAEACGHVLTIRDGLVSRMFDERPELEREEAMARFVAFDGDARGSEAARLSQLFQLVRREWESEEKGKACALEALVRLVLLVALRPDPIDRVADPRRRSRYEDLRRFHSLVEAHFTRHWPITRYAEALKMTESQLHRLCVSLAGKPPKQIVLDRTLLQARRLLSLSELKVAEIAETLGFPDAAYFCRLFKRREGVTPSDYRERAHSPTSSFAEKVQRHSA